MPTTKANILRVSFEFLSTEGADKLVEVIAAVGFLLIFHGLFEPLAGRGGV